MPLEGRLVDLARHTGYNPDKMVYEIKPFPNQRLPFPNPTRRGTVCVFHDSRAWLTGFLEWYVPSEAEDNAKTIKRDTARPPYNAVA